MSTGRKVAVNTIIQILGRVIGMAITLVTINYVANHLVVNGSTLQGFGQYSIVFAYVSIIGAAADLGLFNFLVRELAGKDKEKAGELVANAFWFRLILLVGTFVLALLVTRFLPYSPEVKHGLLVGVIVAFSMLASQVFASVFQANLMSRQIVWSETLGKVAIMLLTIAVLQRGMGITAVVLANLGGNLITIAMGYLLARPLISLRIKPDFSVWRRAVPEFLPLAAVSILGLMHFKVDTLLLSFMKGEADVGIYGLAYKIIEVVLVIPSIFATNLLPVMTSVAQFQGEQIAMLLRRATSILVILGLQFAIFLAVFAPWIIVFISNPEFLQATLPLRILAVAVIFVFISTLLLQAIIAVREQRRVIGAYALVLAVNFGLNLLLIPRFSYDGAALTTVVTEGLLLILLARVVVTRVPGGFDWTQIAKVVAASVVSAGVVMALRWSVALDALAFAGLGKALQIGYLAGGLVAVIAVFALTMTIFDGGRLRSIKELFRLS